MSIPSGILPNLNTNFDFNDSCNCCFPGRSRKSKKAVSELSSTEEKTDSQSEIIIPKKTKSNKSKK